MQAEDGTWSTLTIPYPGPIPRQRGIHAVDKNYKMIVDCTPDELNTMTIAADMVGIPRAQFVRWVCTFAAKEIINAKVCTEPVSAE